MIEDEAGGPRKMAERIEAQLGEIEDALSSASTRAERSALNKQRHQLTQLLLWCETRAGY